MVRHHAVGPNGDAGLACLLSKQISLDLVIVILEETRLAPVAALDCVMWQSGYYDTSQSRHRSAISPVIGVMSTDYPSALSTDSQSTGLPSK